MRRRLYVLITVLMALSFSCKAKPVNTPAIDLDRGFFGDAFIAGDGDEIISRFTQGGAWKGTWKSYTKEGFFVQPSPMGVMAGVVFNTSSWPSRTYDFDVFKGRVSYGIDSSWSLEDVCEALDEKFEGEYYVLPSEVTGNWNGKFKAFKLTAWKSDPPFLFEIYFNPDRMIEELRIMPLPSKAEVFERVSTRPNVIRKKRQTRR